MEPMARTTAPARWAALRMAWPPHWLALLSGAKDFSRNPVIGNATLNRWGLHVLRKRLAHAICQARRRLWLARGLDPVRREAFDRDGFVVIPDFLPPAEWQAMRRELLEAALPMLEMIQSQAVTRRANLDEQTCEGRYPALLGLLRHRELHDWVRYAAGCSGRPFVALQCIHNDRDDAASGRHDPQTDWHSDTFHSAGKAWLFLHEVRADEGPFGYLPGSHLPTPARLRWEREASITAAQHPDPMHAHGSLRATEQDLGVLGRTPPFQATVAANTLVVADTGGFHRRTPSPQPTVRLEIFLSLRRNPFLAGLYPSLLSWPWVGHRWAGWLFRASQWLNERKLPGWRPVPERGLLAPERERLADPPGGLNTNVPASPPPGGPG
jgi:hypothetical protein